MISVMTAGRAYVIGGLVSWKANRFTRGILRERTDKARTLIGSVYVTFVFGSTTKALMPTTDPFYSNRIRLSTGNVSVKIQNKPNVKVKIKQSHYRHGQALRVSEG